MGGKSKPCTRDCLVRSFSPIQCLSEIIRQDGLICYRETWNPHEHSLHMTTDYHNLLPCHFSSHFLTHPRVVKQRLRNRLLSDSQDVPARRLQESQDSLRRIGPDG